MTDFVSIDNYFGFIKLTILPPRNLFIPVLPIKANGKLLFALCQTCANSYQQSKYTHSEQERSINGTYCTEEVKEAIKSSNFNKGLGPDCFDGNLLRNNNQLNEKVITEITGALNDTSIPEYFHVGRLVPL